MRSSNDLTKLINQSGFPLQMAIDRMVTAQSDIIGWRVLSREHGWQGVDGQSGFIDLVLEDKWKSSVLVLECKRVQESDWLFLCESTTCDPSRRTRLWITNTAGHGKEHFGFFDVLSDPESHESMFCVVAGQDPKARPMLERVAAELAAATQALAVEEHPFVTQRQHGIRTYASVVVTTARLFLSRVDSSKVEIATGEVPEATHEEIPWVRFRKPFSSERAIEPVSLTGDYADVATAKEKLVFVVNVLALEKFLRAWAVVNNSLRALM
jgi:hypothetical protein